MNSNLTERSLKHSSNVECAENVSSSHVVECECELRHIPSFSHRQGRNSEFCVTVGPVTRTTDILIHLVKGADWSSQVKHAVTLSNGKATFADVIQR